MTFENVRLVLSSVLRLFDLFTAPILQFSVRGTLGQVATAMRPRAHTGGQLFMLAVVAHCLRGGVFLRGGFGVWGDVGFA